MTTTQSTNLEMTEEAKSNLHSEERDQALKTEKLRLEVEKLKLEAKLLSEEGLLKLQKLRLEISDLQRWQWTKPGTIFPIIATAGTILFAQKQGVFQVAEKKLQIESKEISLLNRDLRSEQVKLAEGNARLLVETTENDRKLKDSKIALQNAQIRSKNAESLAADAENRRRSAYPAYKKMLLSRFSARLKTVCSGTRRMPFMWGTNAFNIKALDRGASTSAFPTLFSTCISAELKAATYLNDLDPADKNKLTSKAFAVIKILDNLRLEAMRAYEDRTYESSAPRFKPTKINRIIEIEVETHDSFPKEPVADWLESRRKYLLEDIFERAVISSYDEFPEL